MSWVWHNTICDIEAPVLDFGGCDVPLHCHNSGMELEYMLGFHSWVKGLQSFKKELLSLFIQSHTSESKLTELDRKTL